MQTRQLEEHSYLMWGYLLTKDKLAAVSLALVVTRFSQVGTASSSLMIWMWVNWGWKGTPNLAYSQESTMMLVMILLERGRPKSFPGWAYSGWARLKCCSMLYLQTAGCQSISVVHGRRGHNWQIHCNRVTSLNPCLHMQTWSKPWRGSLYAFWYHVMK